MLSAYLSLERLLFPFDNLIPSIANLEFILLRSRSFHLINFSVSTDEEMEGSKLFSLR